MSIQEMLAEVTDIKNRLYSLSKQGRGNSIEFTDGTIALLALEDSLVKAQDHVISLQSKLINMLLDKKGT